jgi:hypothetical protein
MIYSLHLRSITKTCRRGRKNAGNQSETHLTGFFRFACTVMMRPRINPLRPQAAADCLNADSAVLDTAASTFEGELRPPLCNRAMDHCPLAACMKGGRRASRLLPAGFCIQEKDGGI